MKMESILPSNEFWQDLSESTGTIVTPANILDSFAMYLAYKSAPKMDTWPGIIGTGASVLADYVNGPIARYTGTDSKLGEAVDAVGDKIKLAYAIKYIWELDLAPKPLLTAVAIQNGLNTGITLAERAIGNGEPQIHSSWAGKRAIFAQQAGIGLYVIATKLEQEDNGRAVQVKKIAAGISAVGMGLGVVSTTGYTKTLIHSVRS